MDHDSTPATPPATQELMTELRWQGRCLSVVALSTVVGMLYLLSSVLVPFVVAIFLTVGLKPILDLFQRYLLQSRLAAVTAAFVLGVALLLILGLAVTSSVDELTHDAAYQRSAAIATERIADLAEKLGLLPEISSDSPNALSSSDRLEIVLQKAATSAQQWLLNGMASLSSSLGIVLIYMYFLLLGASASPEASSELWEMIEGKLREYIVLKTVISIATGLAVWVVLALFQVPLAFLMGLLTFLLNYIPNFGPLVTCILPLPLIWLSPHLSVVSMIAATILTCGVQTVSGNVIEPRMMGSSFDLHPIVVLLALMVWYAIWGFVGVLLAVPMTAALKVILQRLDRTAPLARLLGGDLTVLTVGSQPA
ncbi:AI-2 transport protein TqsA [Planctomycetes bacterium Pan216]|uniref:AI-2 transport protein TqsA n=1 Tax=Kolteria novifilia TaxID=2527975 RepID=A0A518B3Q8_9BACT|nr:AI-2 transport protein TqsA [Planctomycetes bacterium Pan216]